MKEPALIIVKPDGISKRLVGHILTKFSETGLEIVALKIAKATRWLAEEHYTHIKGTSFFEGTVQYFTGKFHNDKKLIAVVYYGEGAIRKCRKIAGATNPEEADPKSIRGAYGRIVKKGKDIIFENVVHVSSDKKEAEREIKLWFHPEDITVNLYSVTAASDKTNKAKKVWK